MRQTVGESWNTQHTHLGRCGVTGSIVMVGFVLTQTLPNRAEQASPWSDRA